MSQDHVKFGNAVADYKADSRRRWELFPRTESQEEKKEGPTVRLAEPSQSND